MDPYKAPAGAGHGHDVDLTAARPGVLPQLGGAVLVVYGMFCGATAIQAFVFGNFYTLAVVVPALQLVLSLLALGCGGLMTRAHLWGTLVAVGVAWGSTLLMVLWVLMMLSWASLSLLALAACLVGVLASVLVPLALPSVVATHRARQALYA